MGYGWRVGAGGGVSGPPSLGGPEPPPPPVQLPEDEDWSDRTGPIDPGAIGDPQPTIKSTRNGQVITDVHVRGSIIVEHNDVTIQNFRLEATAVGGYGVQVKDGVMGCQIRDGELAADPSNDVGSIAVTGSGDYTAERLNIHGWGDGFRPSSNNCLISECWVHDPRDLEGDHNDAVQLLFGTVDIEDCWFDMRTPSGFVTSAVICHGNFADVSHFRMVRTRLAGGGYTLNMKHRNHTIHHAEVHDCVWVRGAWGFGAMTGDALPSGEQWSGNAYDDGTPIVR